MATGCVILKHHDTFPPIEATLKDRNGPINLSSAVSVTFLWRPLFGAADDGTHESVTCTVTSPLAGDVEFEIGTITETLGEFAGEFEIDWGGDNIQTVPNSGYVHLRVEKDIN